MATTGNTCNSLFILLPTFALLLTSCMAANVLTSGQMLGTGQSLSFAQFQFIMQSDCNLVLYDNGNAVWASSTNGQGSGCQCRMQNDGNLVIYNDANQVVWASNTNGATGSYQLILQRDRNVVIYDPSGVAIWATGTNVGAAANVTLSAITGKPTNVTATAVKLNNVTETPDVKITAAGKKITGNGNPTLT